MSMGWVLLFVALALSPLVWLVPSRRQRGSMEVRLQARRLGLAMQLAPQAWPFWLERELPGSCPQYHRPRLRGHVDVWCYWQLAEGTWLNQWREPCEDPRLAEYLARLPADAYKAEATPQMVALCWGERGGEEALQRVDAFLRALA